MKIIAGWLGGRDYEDAKEEISRRIVRRLSRGNVLIQNGGGIMNEKDLRELSERGDRAVEYLNWAFFAKG